MTITAHTRVVIADDEKPACDRLRCLLERDTRVEIVRCCASGAEALGVVGSEEASGRPVHLLFLDVQMPEMDGFGVVSDLLHSRAADGLPLIVFVTAYDDYALRAFDSHAIDYLLKPFSDERFEAALDRAIRFVKAGDAQALISQMRAMLDRPGQAGNEGPASARPTLDRIVVKGSQRVRILPVEQIVWIEAEGVYVNLHTRDGGVHLHRELLGTLDSALDPRQFVRVHRSAIVNIDAVHELRQDPHGNLIAVLRGGAEVRVGRHFRSRLEARLGQAL
jgi:two-component system LytT family response regulator